jgi:hypothetical protein
VTLAASQHVIVDSGTVTTLTNLPAVTTDWLTAAGVKADAVTKIQSGLALDSTVAKDATVSKPGTAQTITPPADMALNSTVAKDATVAKAATALTNATWTDARAAHLDADISSRSTYAGADTSGTTTLLGKILGTLAVGTHYPQSGDSYAVVVNGTSGEAAIYSLLTNGTYGLSALHTGIAAIPTTDQSTNVAAIKTVTDHISTMLIVNGATYRYTADSLTNAPSGGGGSGSDPWVTQLPGAYTAGEAGYIVGNLATLQDIANVIEGTGPYAITFTVQDQDGNKLQGVAIRMLRNAEDYTAWTNSSGVVSVGRNAGTWVLACWVDWSVCVSP